MARKPRFLRDAVEITLPELIAGLEGVAEAADTIVITEIREETAPMLAALERVTPVVSGAMQRGWKATPDRDGQGFTNSVRHAAFRTYFFRSTLHRDFRRVQEKHALKAAQESAPKLASLTHR